MDAIQEGVTDDPAIGTILALLFLTGLAAACDHDEHRIYNNKNDCANAAPSYYQECEGQYED